MNFVLYIGHLGRRELSGATSYPDKRSMRLKRIISVLAAMAIMAAMVAVMVMPAFAKVNTTPTPPECNDDFTVCSESNTKVGGSGEKGGGSGEKSTFNRTLDMNPPVSDTASWSIQGGGKDTGGGNCTYSVTYTFDEEGNPVGSSRLIEGNGSRCPKQ